MNGNSTAAQKLAGYIAGLKYEDIPEELVKKAKGLVLDQLGCQLFGSTLEWNRIVHRFVQEKHVSGPARVVNYGDRVPVEDAAFVNGTFGQGCELDDYYDEGGGHPGAGSVPVALALAHETPLNGKNFIVAMAAGYEVGWRVGRAMLPELSHRGFHSQSTIGVFIAVAAAGKVLGLDQQQMTNALAIAASHAGGTMEFDQSGGEVKRVHNGLAVSGGIRSAKLAQLGLTGPPTIFEGERGVLKVLAGSDNGNALYEGLGRECALGHGAIKRFPVNASQHAPIEVLSNLMDEHGIRPDQVERMEVGVSDIVLKHGGSIVEPTEVIEAQFSLRFSLAVRLIKGNNDLAHYLNRDLWCDPGVLDLGQRLHLYALPEAQGPLRFSCRMKIVLRDGSVAEDYLRAPKGTGTNPLSTTEVEAKFGSLARSVLSEEGVAQLADTVARLDALPDVGIVGSLLSEQQDSEDGVC